MMKPVRLVLLLCLLAITVVGFPAVAQEQNPFGLSADDWALFSGGQMPERTAYDFSSELGIDFGADEFSWDLNGAGQIGDKVFSLILNGNIDASGSDIPLSLEARAVDGSLYISADGGEQWYGGTEEELTQMLAGFGLMMNADLSVNPEDLASGDMSGWMTQPGVMDAMLELSHLDPSTFATVTRLDDVNGNAHFQVTLDADTLLSNPRMAPVIGAMAGGVMSGSSEEMTPEQLSQLAAMMSDMFEGSRFTMDKYIDPATSELQGLVFAVNLNIPSASGMSGAFNLVFDVTLSEPQGSVEAPESFAPISEALSGMGAMMGGV